MYTASARGESGVGHGGLIRLGSMAGIFLLCSCNLTDPCVSDRRPPDQSDKVQISEGVWGQVWSWEGNFQPDGCPGGRVKGVSRMVVVYEATPVTDASTYDGGGPGWWISDMPSPAVDSVRSDENGFFEISTPPGRYSLLIREGTALYINTLGTDMVLGEVQVTSGAVSMKQLDLQHQASF